MQEDTCSCQSDCLILPFEGELSWPKEVRGIFYAVGMIYFFIGVSIVADMFMGSIEAITSRRKQVMLPTGKIVTNRIWNDTVANLTLMALGSSAPEIMLSVIELFKRDMTMGELGPQTIVGSASFNLFMIVGLCILVIPSTESRYVRQYQVFGVTAVFMFFAYFWLVISISLVSPGIVEIWEALVTLLALPVLVVLSYLSDIGALPTCAKRGSRSKSVIEAQDVNKLCELIGNHERETREAAKLALALRPKGAPPLSELSQGQLDQIRRQVQKGRGQRKSRAARRVEATRALTGGRKISYEVTQTWASSAQVAGVTGASLEDVPIAAAKGTGKPIVQFACAAQTLSSELSGKTVVIKRSGEINDYISLVLYYTVNRITAMDDGMSSQRNSRMRSRISDMRQSSVQNNPTIAKQCSILEMGPKELQKDLAVKVPTVGDAEHTIGFTVDLVAVEVQGGKDDDPTCEVQLGQITCTEVEIGRADQQGVLAFCFEHIMVQGMPDKQILEVMVQRQGGCTGTVSCSYRTESLTAISGHDYEDVEGEIEFKEGVTEQFIEIEILPKGKHENKDQFLLVLEHAEGGCTFHASHDGGEDAEICTITIAQLKALDNSRMGNFIRSMDAAMNFDALRLGNSEWKEAWTAAVFCNGSLEEQRLASTSDWVFHIIALPWKLLFCLIPPTAYFHGWACFWISLFFIGLCTAFIGDLAELFGCVLKIDDTITALLFVALGTSMPDLFASRTAATQDPFADASIVNVTGSNSVNVFLGLGIPWTIGAIYWQANGRTAEWTKANPALAAELQPGEARFVAPTAGLVFSVMVFSVGAVIAVGLLGLRRKVVGAELGGPLPLKVISGVTFFALWFADISLVSWYVLRWDISASGEKVMVLLIVVIVIVLLVGLTCIIACQTARAGNVYASEEASVEGISSVSMEARKSAGLKDEPRPPKDHFHQDGFRCSV